MRIRVGPTTWAWEPVTPRGVAAFAGAPTGRVLGVQFLFAALLAAVVLWFMHSVWYPTLWTAVRQLPAQGEVRNSQLAWPAESPELLAGDRFLALVVDVDHEADLGHDADLCVEFGRDGVRVFSLFGYRDFPYPPDEVVSTSRQEVESWWGAWAPVILWITALAVILTLELLWFVLATIYSVPVWIVAFFANRELGFRQAWRLAAAALMPGALVLALTIFLYGLDWLNFMRLGLGVALHVVVGWVYIFVSPAFLPRSAAVRSSKQNPFAP